MKFSECFNNLWCAMASDRIFVHPVMLSIFKVQLGDCDRLLWIGNKCLMEITVVMFCDCNLFCKQNM